MKLDRKVKDIWIKALRSGKYKQGRGGLKHENQHGTYYCCLGVLIEVSPVPLSTMDKGSEAKNAYIDNPTKIGLKHESQKLLAKMNDDGRGFEKIADYIDKRL